MDLPTEAQWEYAARNRGQYILYPTDNGKIDIGRNVWSFEQRQNQQNRLNAFRNIPELLKFPATSLGLYDMITDNYEWMLDWYDPQYYSKSPEKTLKVLQRVFSKLYVVQFLLRDRLYKCLEASLSADMLFIL